MSYQIKDNKIKKYHKDGYVILNNFLKKDNVKNIRNELRKLIYDQAKKFNVLINKKNSLEENIKLIFLTNYSARKFIYDLVRNITSIKNIQFSNKLIETLKLLGFENPIGLNMPTIRFDISLMSERKFLTLPHQDLRSIRSNKCASILIPISKINEKIGTIKIWPRTFKDGLLKHSVNNGQLSITNKNLIERPFDLLSANPRDLIINNSFNIHSSHPGLRGSLRMTAQFMMNDGMSINSGDKYFELKKVPDFKDSY